MSTYYTQSDLGEVLEYEGLSKSFASGIIKKGGKEGKISVDKAQKIIKNLTTAIAYQEKYAPKPLIENETLLYDDLLLLVDDYFSRLKEKYKPYGLNVPFSTWEEARKWLQRESLSGVLTTNRIDPPTIEGKELWKIDLDVYKANIIHLPYEKTPNGINSLLCNSSPFLLELNYVIGLLTDYTGINKIELVQYFFCNTKPCYLRISVLKYELIHQFFKIQINTDDLTREEWLELFNLYREETNKKRKKRLSENLKKFAEILAEFNVPEKPKADFYKIVLQRWNEETGENIEEWRNMRSKHKSLLEYQKRFSLEEYPLLKIIKKRKMENEEAKKEY